MDKTANAVKFDKEDKRLYEELKFIRMTAQTFDDFVKGAFYDKVERLWENHVPLR